jgi:hypothetical protein
MWFNPKALTSCDAKEGQMITNSKRAEKTGIWLRYYPGSPRNLASTCLSDSLPE